MDCALTAKHANSKTRPPLHLAARSPNVTASLQGESIGRGEWTHNFLSDPRWLDSSETIVIVAPAQMVNTYHFPDAQLNHMVIRDLEQEYRAELIRNEVGRVVGCRMDENEIERFLQRFGGLRKHIVEFQKREGRGD